jgi:hypothetical protein
MLDNLASLKAIKTMIEQNTDLPAGVQPVPRPDLRETAFRRYEIFIAEAAVKKTLIVDFSRFPCGPKKTVRLPRTFIARFNDAKLGYKRYCYSSTLIPKGFDVANLLATELSDGTVLIENQLFSTTPLSRLLTSSHTAIEAFMRNGANGSQPIPPSGIDLEVDPLTIDDDMDFMQALETELGGRVLVCEPKNNIVKLL